MQKHMKGHKPEEVPADWRIEKTYLYVCYVWAGFTPRHSLSGGVESPVYSSVHDFIVEGLHFLQGYYYISLRDTMVFTVTVCKVYTFRLQLMINIGKIGFTMKKVAKSGFKKNLYF